ncbi:MAG: hypothetical protein O2887_13500 [Bacteroidetes bacterium]|nr:hypothetical protein [Bacteroidota bacterium]MDA1121487.1 hypothetical protein [Bacteroidota bacterium]
MKKTTLAILTMLLAPLGFSQILTDSLIVEEPLMEDLQLNQFQDSIQNPASLQEVSMSSDTVIIKEIVYDTIYMSTPIQTLEDFEDEDNDINPEDYDVHYYRKHWRGSEIKTLSGKTSHSGGFGAISFKSSKFRSQTIVLAGLRGGWIINRSLAIGLEAHGIIPTAKFTDVSPSGDAVLLGGYGGLFLEPIVFSNEVVHVTFPISAGSGWIGYHENFDEGQFNSPDLIEGDVFWYVEPGANIELNIAKNFRIALGMSKRITQDLELTNTKSNDFDKLNYYLTLKIGSF